MKTLAQKSHLMLGIKLTDSEKEILRSPPNHHIHARIDKHEVKIEIEKAFIKDKWQEARELIENKNRNCRTHAKKRRN